MILRNLCYFSVSLLYGVLLCFSSFQVNFTLIPISILMEIYAGQLGQQKPLEFIFFPSLFTYFHFIIIIYYYTFFSINSFASAVHISTRFSNHLTIFNINKNDEQGLYRPLVNIDIKYC